MTDTITSTDQFLNRWHTPPNFRIDPSVVPFKYQPPRLIDVLDAFRNDPEIRVTILDTVPAPVRTAHLARFRTAPVDEVAKWPFRLVHFNLPRFYSTVFKGFAEEVMIPWRTYLSQHGFTWLRINPYVFLSGPGASSTYHTDRSHGLVIQAEGVKTFHSYVNPDQIVSPDDAANGMIAAERPPAPGDAPRQPDRMEPGNILWSHLLTPHWVTGWDEGPSMNITLAHGGLCHQGSYARREEVLRGFWDAHPERAWMEDLRAAKY
ncbi:MAG: hypothetical protein ACRDT6_08690 [Micromonosporaceae bacterium]